MRFSIAAAFMATTVLAAPQAAQLEPGRFSCGTPDPTAEQLAIAQEFLKEEAYAIANGTLAKRAVTYVDTYFHVVASSTAASDGYISDSLLTAQFNALNAAYAPHQIQFVLKGTDKTVNSNWARDGAGYELTMKKALRKGTYKALNIYFLKDMGSNLGYCYFPTSVTANSNNFWKDGCTVLHTTVPGGTLTNYNKGHTVTHEVGHWLGLYHTFQGGCTGAGDSVADTPAQASASSGCPVGRDSCPSQAGADPIRNYMDYSYDTCYDNFTPGQAARINSFWTTYRASCSAC
ncbi:hypothetical protein QBC38DRAFT_255847 [Podospora fimiseda]|uniref:Peptidase M43 pregnancy-associated plasma-A domain-containing protein n=1 Tax=Podospora fimiseda TaxID=252190 RepID=A0AAN7BLP4_9PEZI|nr:hypothetical protein QBC38DRAFT_255847 [Podospora fimiseda]